MKIDTRHGVAILSNGNHKNGTVLGPLILAKTLKCKLAFSRIMPFCMASSKMFMMQSHYRKT